LNALSLTDSVGNLKNVGVVKLEKLQKLGIYTVKNLLTHYPRDYMDRRVVSPISEIMENGTYSIRASVIKTELLNYRSGVVVKTLLSDETGEISAVWFGRSFLKNVFCVGEVFMFYGVVSQNLGKLQMESPDYEVVGKEMLKSARITPVYPSTDKISQNLFRSLIKDVLNVSPHLFDETLPSNLIEKYDLCDKNYAIKNIHFPENDEGFFAARKRLVFEELLITQLCLFHIKGSLKKNKGFIFSNIDTRRIEAAFQYTLTNAQKSAIDDMKADFCNGFAMNRLVQGDVGSGKTVIAQIGCYMAAVNGFQSAVMAPTETLAEQHFESFKQLFEELDIRVECLTGSLNKKQKDDIKKRLANGEIDIIIGTHALIQDSVYFAKLGFAVTDEQHRFGVRQRAKLSNTGENPPHVLVMTATPIPRTLALILYGDLDITSIKELPPGRQPINTTAVSSYYHKRIYEFIKKQKEEGRQTYIICPAVNQSEKINVKAVVEYTEALKTIFSGELKIECLYGGMKPTEKREIMRKFAEGETDVLVSTTVIEVGINVPNATVMLIENSDRFGLSQLHQLRGRVGRGAEKSYCVLVSDSKSEVAKERMKAMTKTNDGFVISEMDLELRGPGEFFGTRQHGLPEMKISNLYKDSEILIQTREAVAEMLKKRHYLKENALMNEIKTLTGEVCRNGDFPSVVL